MRKAASIALLLLLTSCAPVPPGEKPPASPAETRSEENPIPKEPTDAATERLLPTGILEIGNRDAPLTLLLFTEHHCRYCHEFSLDHLPKLMEEFVAPGTLKLQVGILPLKKYRDSDAAALGMICAAQQNKGLAMHQLLLVSEQKNAKTIGEHAAGIGLDADLFVDCLNSDAAKAKLDLSASLARSLDVTLVPTFFLNGEKSVGLPYWPDLRGMIEERMNDH